MFFKHGLYFPGQNMNLNSYNMINVLGYIYLKHEAATWQKSQFYIQSTFWSSDKLNEKRKESVSIDKWEGKGGLYLTKINCK